MKKNMSKAIALLLASCLIIASFTGCSNPFRSENEFKKTDKGYGFYRYSDSSTSVSFTVTDEYEGEKVTELMPFCLSNAQYLESLYIGKNIDTIDCWSLTNCPALKEIIVDPENEYFTSQDGVLYNKDMTKLLVYPNSRSKITRDNNGNVTGGGEFTVPESVTEIGDNAFYLCSELYKITFNEKLEKIGTMAFIKCYSLCELKLPSSLKELGTDAFSYCDSLKIVEIPSSVTKIGDYAFFSTASNIEKIIVNSKEENVELGSDWIPDKAGSVGSKVPVEFVGG